MAAMFKAVVGDRFSTTSYKYNDSGRLIERMSTIGNLGGDQTTYLYGDHDDPIEKTTEDRRRGADFDENRNVRYSPDEVNVQHARMEYRYDAYGNWIEKTVSIRSDSAADFERSNMESRVITYCAG